MHPFRYSLLLLVSVFAACSHKTLPAVSGKPVTKNTTASPAAIVIIDGHGNLLVSEKDLPAGASRSILNLNNARAFSPEQTKRLVYRFHAIPPKVIYVPGSLIRNSPKGSYYIYHQKFWYWEKKDGFFYLDENYYK